MIAIKKRLVLFILQIVIAIYAHAITISGECDDFPKPLISHSGTTIICSGDSVKLIVPEGLSYKWSNGATTREIYARENGKYSVEVKYAENCFKLSDTVVVKKGKPILKILAEDHKSNCHAGSIKVKVDSIRNITWNNGSVENEIELSDTALVSPMVTDIYGCKSKLKRVVKNNRDTISWYRYQKLVKYIVQRNAIAFKYIGEVTEVKKFVSGLTQRYDKIIDSTSIIDFSGSKEGWVEIYLLNEGISSESEEITNKIYEFSGFVEELIPVKSESNINIKEISLLGNRVSVAFKGESISREAVLSFTQKYNLKTIIAPSEGKSGIYLFEMIGNLLTSDEVAKKTFECDSSIISSVEPEITNLLRRPIISTDTFWVAGTVGLAANKSELISVSPNPFSTTATIKINTSENSDLIFSLYDFNGTKVRIFSFSGNESLVLNKENLQSGVYYYLITENSNDSYSGKIIIE